MADPNPSSLSLWLSALVQFRVGDDFYVPGGAADSSTQRPVDQIKVPAAEAGAESPAEGINLLCISLLTPEILVARRQHANASHAPHPNTKLGIP